MKILERVPINRKVALVALALAPLLPSPASAQYAPPPYASAPQAMPFQASFSQQQLEQMLAPIALYPDTVLGQVLMAATLPAEVAEAARWTRANASLQGEYAVGAAQAMGWDSSVAALTAFPELLAQMEQNPEWVRALGDAFLADEPRVMDAVQDLRRRAQSAGTLNSDAQVRIEQEGQWLSIQPAQPLVTYVPYYDPLVAYGAWPWASYPPVYWRPWAGYRALPGYRFAWGPGVRHSAPARFGRFDWAQRRFEFAGPRPALQRHTEQQRPAIQQRAAPAEVRRDARPRTEAPRFEGRRGFDAPRPATPAAAAPAPRIAMPAPRNDPVPVAVA
jgi:hypothetical protein